MSQEFKKCLERGKIKRFSPGKKLAGKELKLAGEDLAIALESLKTKKYKWSIVQAYYSMFHSARALIYSENYREKSHYCLIIALRHLYVDPGKLPVYFIESLQKGKALREDADYYDDWSQAGSEEALKLAEEFLNKAKETIKAISPAD